MMPLTLADVDRCYTIRKISGKDDVRRHLNNLGLVEKEEVSVKQSIDGNLIVEIKGVRLALDSSLARRIQV
jgi:ferrous iron transport protein A